MNDLQKVYGDNAKSFSYNNTGMLVFNGDVKSLTKEQQAIFTGMNQIMGQEQTTNVVYANSYTVMSGVNKDVPVVLNTAEWGGALASKDLQVGNSKQNFIVVSPNISDVTVKSDGANGGTQIVDFASFNQDVLVKQNTTSGLFHEMGEINCNNIYTRGMVVGYENLVRTQIGLPYRPTDMNGHSNFVKNVFK